MIQQILFILLVSSFFWIYTNGAILNCDYSEHYNEKLNKHLYQCKGELLQLNENDTIIKSVTKPSNRQSSMSYVVELIIENQNLIRFPSDAENFFEELKFITVKNASIKNISNEILKAFPSLVELDLSINQISVIPKDLFIYNENLQFIYFAENRINFLSPESFDGLKSLKVIDFMKNTGINEIASTPDEISYFKIKLLVKNLEKRQTETMEKMFIWLAKCEFKFGSSAH
ncbi:unnamed protein product [Chironomus riparius]|uniref:Uncharacterized protein n=1 Tax=Chironomus riparius TaxID=315576 RepID=A0A9P0J4S9_9DIPT|nr:unnamed protein product [Chironomus riparius]